MNEKSVHEMLQQRVAALEAEVSEQNRSAKKLASRQDLMTNLLENLQLAITVWDRAGTLLYANPSFTLLTGYATGDIRNLNGWLACAFPNPDYRKEVMDDWQTTVDRTEVLREFKLTCKGGQVKDVEFRCAILPEGRTLVSLADITGRRQAEEALRKSEARYQSIWENSGTATLMIEADTSISMVNAEFEKISGLSKDQIEGRRSWTDFVVPEDLVQMRKYHQERRQQAGAAPRQYEFGFLDKDGHVKHVVNTVALIPGTQQSISSLIDISARKAMEEGLRESQELHAKLMSAIPDMVVRLGLDGTILSVNDFGLQVSGYAPHEVEGQSMLMFILPEDHARVLEDTVRMLEAPLGPREYHLVMKDGRRLLFEVNGDILRHPDGTPYEMVTVCRDITARKKAEQALRESEARYRAVLEASPDPIVAYDITGKVTYLNPAFTKVFGWSLGELRDRRIDYVPEDQLAVTRKMIEKVKRGESFAGFQTRRRTKAGHELDISMSAAIWRNSAGEPVGSVVTLQDISDRKKMEQQLVQAYKMEALGTLAGGIAHDFNNLLSALIGYAELSLSETQQGTLIHGNLHKILKAGERAKDLVKQILTFSRQSDQELLPIQIRPIVAEVLKFIRASLPTTIEIHPQLVCDATVMADPTQIHQVLMNLCTNAAYAMQENGGILGVSLLQVDLPDPERQRPEISPGAEIDLARGTYLLIEVSDTGHGIPPDVISRIFDPFFTTKPAGKGTGMGLSVVHGIVKSHGGAITVSSIPAKGTTFKVWLPMIAVHKTVEREKSLPLPTGSESVLLVDDEAFQIDIGEQMLRKLGYRVVGCNRSVEALRLFKEQPENFDLVITDMTMPEMTGDVLAQELLKIRPDLPVIICTGFSEKMTPETAAAVGVKGFLMKPVVMADMATMVRKILDRIKADG
jgi:PAS domain S-box-containing protein